MAGSRTIKTLLALLVAMTVGAFALMLIRSEPIHLSPTPAIARDGRPDYSSKYFNDLSAPLRDASGGKNWLTIVVHTSANESADIVKRCHFVIDRDGGVLRTDRWLRQENGDHVSVAGGYWNNSSIGIVVLCDASRKTTLAQREELYRLETALRQRFGIPDSSVHAHGDISNSPDPLCGMLGN